MNSFIFGGNTGETAESLKRKREIANQLIRGRRVSSVGEGIASAIGSVAGGLMNSRLDDTERRNQEGASSLFKRALMGESAPTGMNGLTPPPNASQSLAGRPFSAAPKSMNGDQQSFIDALLPAAIEESKRTNIDPRIIVAQAAQETGWGKSAPGNNFFGIKSHGQSGGQNLNTHEYVDGKRVNISDSFRQYESPADSVRGYGDFMLNNPRYGKLRQAEGLDNQLAALQASGYATDPNYGRSVGSIARGIQLPQNAGQAANGLAQGGQQPQPQPQQAAQSSFGGVDPALIEAYSNPWMSQEQRQFLGMRIQQQMQAQQQASDPLRQLQIQQAQRDLNAPDKRGVLKGADGFNYYQDNGERVLPNVQPPQEPAKAPTVKILKDADGTDRAVQWDAESNSWVPINAPTGGATVTPKTKLTESQSKLTLFKSLQTETQPVLLDLEKQFNPGNLPDAFADGVLGGNFFKSEQGQMYSAASTAWAEGALRIATGAAATPEEMVRTKNAYFARPGDSPATIQFKAQMRNMYDRSIQRALGNQGVDGKLPLPSEFSKQFEKSAPGKTGDEPSLDDLLRKYDD